MLRGHFQFDFRTELSVVRPFGAEAKNAAKTKQKGRPRRPNQIHKIDMVAETKGLDMSYFHS